MTSSVSRVSVLGCSAEPSRRTPKLPVSSQHTSVSLPSRFPRTPQQTRDSQHLSSAHQVFFQRNRVKYIICKGIVNGMASSTRQIMRLKKTSSSHHLRMPHCGWNEGVEQTPPPEKRVPWDDQCSLALHRTAGGENARTRHLQGLPGGAWAWTPPCPLPARNHGEADDPTSHPRKDMQTTNNAKQHTEVMQKKKKNEAMGCENECHSTHRHANFVGKVGGVGDGAWAMERHSNEATSAHPFPPSCWGAAALAGGGAAQ